MLLNERSGSSTTIMHKKDHYESPARIERLLSARRNRKVPCITPEEGNVMITSMLRELKTLAPSSFNLSKKVELCSK